MKLSTIITAILSALPQQAFGHGGVTSYVIDGVEIQG
jgi:hypothetical protein